MVGSVLQILRRYCAQLAVACPTPVRAAEDWLEPRDTERLGEGKIRRGWCGLKRARADSPICLCVHVYVKDPRAEEPRSGVFGDAPSDTIIVCLNLLCT